MATRPILMGVDGSEESLRAVEWAARQAERHRSPLRIVSAPALPPRMRAQVDPVTVANALRGMSAQALAAALTRTEEVAPGLAVDTGLLSGAPAVALSAAGDGASMLVVALFPGGACYASCSRFPASRSRSPGSVGRSVRRRRSGTAGPGTDPRVRLANVVPAGAPETCRWPRPSP